MKNDRNYIFVMLFGLCASCAQKPVTSVGESKQYPFVDTIRLSLQESPDDSAIQTEVYVKRINEDSAVLEGSKAVKSNGTAWQVTEMELIPYR